MNGKWIRKRFTFMVISDANSHVIRFRIAGVVLYFGVIAVLCALGAAYYYYQVHKESELLNGHLKAEMTDQTQTFAESLLDKNSTIEQLQSELIRLSDQAEAIKAKVEEFKKFESEMKSIAGTDGKGGPLASAPPSGEKPATAGIGGTNVPASEKDVDDLVEQARHNYSTIGDEINALTGSLTVTKQKVLETQHLLQVTPTLWPTISHAITSGFGVRIDPFTKAPSYHSGIDFGANLGDPAYVTADGTVKSTGSDSTHGNNIVVTHENGLSTWYMHLSKIGVKPGETVVKGQIIGRTGNTGRSTGPHLHYEVLLNGVSIDPKPYLQAVRKDD
ncbi:peptidoglycan DD-metalloendopeptidase family protein [Paenibacillus cymbidii]|uniref:peptidoglycan DD-metalloendopeptidase family protein n=1 Tax=Paenibacillus cymbidii TaxID=1639034 RepID=UPI0010802009|nr:peptidoglycan DD-metalloendopeptidase family protein [Paenibacillus cymbidii]